MKLNNFLRITNWIPCSSQSDQSRWHFKFCKSNLCKLNRGCEAGQASFKDHVQFAGASCSDNMFQCADGTCIPWSSTCRLDSLPVCQDGSHLPSTCGQLNLVQLFCRSLPKLHFFVFYLFFSFTSIIQEHTDRHV